MKQRWRTRFFSLALALLAAFAPARAEYWTDVTERPVVCCDGRAGCQVLHMVMMGSFAGLNPQDSLNTRVLSAVLPMLCEITSEDFTHFCEEFGTSEHVVRRLYHIAMGYCLWADIPTRADARGEEAAARRVLLLFLAPESQADAAWQMALIRREMTPERIKTIAQAAQLPVEFVQYLIESEDWRNPSDDPPR